MKSNWLWDRKTSINEVKKILKNPKNKKFLKFAALLLSRENSPKEVFSTKYLNPIDFCHNWRLIKKVMRKDNWNDPRIEFWQAIYEKLVEKYRRKKIQINGLEKEIKPVDELCRAIGGKIENIRKQKGFTQKQLAKKMKVSQQLISRVESGGENISLTALKKIAIALGSEISIEIR
ncbi:MAG: helix-turn-helix transcriptional regulator [Elusimicrobiota bacterium]